MIRSLCLFLLALPGLLPLPALANALVPADRWIEKVAVARPVIAYRLGLVDLVTPGGEIANELPAAARIVLKRAGFFAADGAQRAHVGMAIQSLGGGKAVVEYTVRGGTPVDGPVLFREVVSTETDNHSVADENTNIRVLSGNLKLFALGLRTRFDPGFAAQATQLAADAREEVGSRGLLSYIGEGAANALVATVEGTGEVLGTLGEIAASEEFQRGLASAADEYSRQQADMAAERAAEHKRMAAMQAAAQREREVRAANERARQAGQQAEQKAEKMQRAAAVQQQAAERQLAQAAQRKAESEARAARQAAEQKERAARQEAERAARIARQEQEARENAARQMRGFVQSSNAARNSTALADAGEARVGADPVPVASKPSRGRARAWCRVTKGGEYWCNGPLQNGGWGNTVKKALAMVDCPDGSGYTPTYGTGGTSFDCGRELRSTEQEMPLYDPFYKYGKSN
ncbi:hypothetical protein ACSUZJ_15515 [Telluria sp. B2]